MVSNNNLFKIEFTKECIEEVTNIYSYISNNLKDNIAAKRLIEEMMERILDLENFPELYIKIGKTDRLKRDYHKMVIKNYIVLYSIDFLNKKVFISHIIYQRRNYFKLI